MPDRNKLWAEQYNADVALLGGYAYVACPTASTKFNSERRANAVRDALQKAKIEGVKHKVLDIGTGDGAYTPQWQEIFQPSSLIGIDLAEKAIALAQEKYGRPNRQFRVANAQDLPFEDHSFDIAVFRDVIHHIEDPILALQEGARVAKRLVIIEPNGYNPIVKGIEKISPYHRAHGEKSYAPFRLINWLKNAGCKIEYKKYFGIIPMYCPNWFAGFLKSIEPAFEQLPGGRCFYTGSIILLARTPFFNS